MSGTVINGWIAAHAQVGSADVWLLALLPIAFLMGYGVAALVSRSWRL